MLPIIRQTSGLLPAAANGSLTVLPLPSTTLVLSDQVDDRGVWAPDWRRGQTRRIIIDRAGTKHYYVVAGS
jgi:hypothetical protein